jgi:hypothetical protein
MTEATRQMATVTSQAILERGTAAILANGR